MPVNSQLLSAAFDDLLCMGLAVCFAEDAYFDELRSKGWGLQTIYCTELGMELQQITLQEAFET